MSITTTTIEDTIDKGFKAGYEKILDLILNAVGVPSFLKGPLKKFISAVIVKGVEIASDPIANTNG
ncbi:MAG: hypothetical protein Q4D57_05700 [Clostridia bacterium]|nr:hypothetical protein [Clostridia bacterium]